MNHARGQADKESCRVTEFQVSGSRWFKMVQGVQGQAQVSELHGYRVAGLRATVQRGSSWFKVVPLAERAGPSGWWRLLDKSKVKRQKSKAKREKLKAQREKLRGKGQRVKGLVVRLVFMRRVARDLAQGELLLWVG
jgi:hypothetical protein